jgi:hypothetical protein
MEQPTLSGIGAARSLLDRLVPDSRLSTQTETVGTRWALSSACATLHRSTLCRSRCRSTVDAIDVYQVMRAASWIEALCELAAHTR